MRRCIAVVALLLAAGCGTKAPDYQSVWSSSSAAPTTTTTGPPVPISQYLEESGVVGLPMKPDTLKDLTVSVPQPPGWTAVTDPKQQAAYQILRKTDVTAYPPTVLLMVFKLMGNFDTAEAIKHGYADAEMSDGFKRLNASMNDFRGFPSAMIEGSYNLNGQRLHTYNRIVIATGPAPANQRYLVQFTVTTAANQAQAVAADVEKIIGGFTVATK